MILGKSGGYLLPAGPEWKQRLTVAVSCAERKVLLCGASQVARVVKNLPANAGDIRDAGSIPDWGSFLEEGMDTHSRILARRAPWTEEPGWLQTMSSQSETRLRD